MNNADVLKRIKPADAMLLIKSAGLRKKDGRILVMRYVQEMNCDEIADNLCIEVESARNLVCKARKAFNRYTEG